MLIGYYNKKHPERLAGLLRKISHEIICRCRTRVSLSEILYVGSIKNSMVLSHSVFATVAYSSHGGIGRLH